MKKNNTRRWEGKLAEGNHPQYFYPLSISGLPGYAESYAKQTETTATGTMIWEIENGDWDWRDRR